MIDVMVVLFRASADQFLLTYPASSALDADKNKDFDLRPEFFSQVWPEEPAEQSEQGDQTGPDAQTADFLHIVLQLESIWELTKELSKSLDKQNLHVGLGE